MTRKASLALLLLGTACTGQGTVPAAPLDMANPASSYCLSLGGRLEIRKEANGDVGYCHLPDGRVIEEWALFRQEKQD